MDTEGIEGIEGIEGTEDTEFTIDQQLGGWIPWKDPDLIPGDNESEEDAEEEQRKI
jgi:hypothetical protein